MFPKGIEGTSLSQRKKNLSKMHYRLLYSSETNFGCVKSFNEDSMNMQLQSNGLTSVKPSPGTMIRSNPPDEIASSLSSSSEHEWMKE